MERFASALSIRGFLESLDFSHSPKLFVVPSASGRNVLKNTILEEKGGLFGIEILTPDEIKRRTRRVMAFEGAVLWAAITGSEDLGRCRRIFSDLVRWGAAGYPMEEIPLPLEDKKGVEGWLKVLRAKKFKTPWEKGWLPARAHLLGFGPQEAWDIVRDNPHSEITLSMVEPSSATVAQMAAVGSLEKVLGECGTRHESPAAAEVMTLARAGDFPQAIIEALNTHPAIDKIIWQGPAVEAALRGVADTLKLPLAPQNPWGGQEKILRYARAQLGAGWMSLWEYKRAQLMWAGVPTREEEKKLRNAWQDESDVGDFYPEFKKLPDTLTLKEVKELIPAEFWEGSVDNFEVLEKLLPTDAALSKKIWLAMLVETPLKQERTMGGVASYPIEEAWGLVDEKTLLCLSQTTPLATESLLDPTEVSRRNAHCLQGPEDSPTLAQGWINLTDALETCQIKDQRALAAVVIKEKENKKEAAVLFEKESPEPTRRHASHHYELPAPVQASCKQWEAILQKPQAGWFETLRLKSLWRPDQKSEEPLWVGNWSHAAVQTGVDEFFAAKKQKKGNFFWQMALARAWENARHFEGELAKLNLPTLPLFEQDIKGAIGGVRTYGRLDCLAHTGRGTLIVDFKTSPRVEKIPTPNAKNGKDKLADEADGFQLWLYGRLYKQLHPQESVSICRLSPSSGIDDVREVTDVVLEAEKRMEDVGLSGVLGQTQKMFGRFGGAEGRVPYATQPTAEEEEAEDE